jgi:hypothetical protein
MVVWTALLKKGCRSTYDNVANGRMNADLHGEIDISLAKLTVLTTLKVSAAVYGAIARIFVIRTLSGTMRRSDGAKQERNGSAARRETVYYFPNQTMFCMVLPSLQLISLFV